MGLRYVLGTDIMVIYLDVLMGLLAVEVGVSLTLLPVLGTLFLLLAYLL